LNKLRIDRVLAIEERLDVREGIEAPEDLLVDHQAGHSEDAEL